MEEYPHAATEPPRSPGPLERAYYERLRFADYYQPSRRGILHLLAWGILTAALMIINWVLWRLGPQVGGSDAQQILSALVQSGYSIVQAAALVGGIVFWIDRLRQEPGSLQPGHWILAINSIAIPGMLLLYALNSCISNFSIRPFQHFVYPIYALFMLLQSAAYGWAAWRLPEYQRWKWGLGLLSLEGLGFCFAFFLIALQPILSASFAGIAIQTGYLFEAMNFFKYFVGAFLVVFMLVDLSRGLRRDWLHWLGASVPVAIAGITLVGEVAKIFIPR